MLQKIQPTSHVYELTETSTKTYQRMLLKWRIPNNHKEPEIRTGVSKSLEGFSENQTPAFPSTFVEKSWSWSLGDTGKLKKKGMTAGFDLGGYDESDNSQEAEPEHPVEEQSHYCSLQSCPRSESGEGFKSSIELIRHNRFHTGKGYMCPFCPERDQKYGVPENLQR